MTKAVLKNLAIFAGKRLCWSPFLIKFIKKRLQHRCFPVNISKILRAPILKCLRSSQKEDESLKVTSAKKLLFVIK